MKTGFLARPQWIFFIIAALYTVLAVLVFNILEIKPVDDFTGYKEAARFSLLSIDFWTHWRAATFVLLIKMFGSDLTTLAWVQFALNLTAWLLFAGTTASFLEHLRLRVAVFVVLLVFSLGIDFFVWNAILLTESLDNTLILVMLTMFMWLHYGMRAQVSPSLRKQSAIAVSFVLIIFLWGFSRPPNYFNALVLVPFLGLVFIKWRLQLRAWWPTFGTLIVALLTVYVLRSYLVDYSDVWQNGMMNTIAANILPDEKKTEFFVERGMPDSPEAMRFKGYVPARYAGDWEAVYGDWINTKSRRVYMEFLLLTAPQRIQEAAQRWNQVVNPDMLTYLYGRTPQPQQQLPIWQRENAALLYNPSGITFLVLALVALFLMLSRFRRRETDWRWLIPLVMIVSTLPIALLNLNADAYEARHHTANSLKLRLGILLLVFYSVDYLVIHMPKWRWKPALLGTVSFLLALEFLSGYILTRDHLIYPLASLLFPNTNVLKYHEVDEDAYRVYQYAPLDSVVFRLQVDCVGTDCYQRAFRLAWVQNGIYPEIRAAEGQTSILWRNSPQPISVDGPKGPIFGAFPVSDEQSIAWQKWQEVRLPGLLALWDADYIFIKASMWRELPTHEQRIFENSDLYEFVKAWNSGDRLYRIAGSQTTWAELASGQNGLSEATSEQAQAAAQNLPLPANVIIFNPQTGSVTEPQTEIGGFIEATQPSPALLELWWILGLMHTQDSSFFDEEQRAAIDQWRSDKDPAPLHEAGIEYIIFSNTWWQWLTAEEQGRFQDPDQYEPIRIWQDGIFEPYYLYRINTRGTP